MEKCKANNNLRDTHPMQPEKANFTYALVGAISPSFLDANAATRWLVHRLHPDGPACPYCSALIISRQRRATWESLGRVKCPRCPRTFTAITGTPLHGSTLTPADLVLMALLMAAGLDNAAIAERVGCDRTTVYRWRPRLLEGVL